MSPLTKIVTQIPGASKAPLNPHQSGKPQGWPKPVAQAVAGPGHTAAPAPKKA